MWLLLALVWFASLEARPLLEPDEGRYAEIPREMLASGDWITPRLDGLKYFEKPPLQYWATAAFYQVFGRAPWTARLWTCGLAFLCLPLVYAWAGRIAGTRAGLTAMALLAVSPLFGIVGHLNMLDAGFTFWLCLALFAFTRAQASPVAAGPERRWMALAWAAAALAVLSKGIVVGVLCGASLAAYSALTRDLSPWRRLHPVSGLAIFAVIAVPWFLAVSARNPGFAGFFFVHEHFARFLTTVHRRAEPWWYFIAVGLLGTLPWLLPLARATVQTVRASLAGRAAATSARPTLNPLAFLLIFACVTLVFFSLSGSKLPPYILPMMPPLAVLAGCLASSRPDALLRGAAWMLALMVGVVVTGLLIYCVRRNSELPAPVALWAAVAVGSVLIGLVFTARRLSRELLTPALALTAAGVLAWQSALAAYSLTPPMRSARDLAAAVRPLIHPQTLLVSAGQYRQSLPPYLGRTLQLLDFKGELEYGLSQEPGRQDLTYEEFGRRWRASPDAIGFFEPSLWARYQAQGLPGRIVAADIYTVAVSRQ